MYKYNYVICDPEESDYFSSVLAELGNNGLEIHTASAAPVFSNRSLRSSSLFFEKATSPAAS
jgi:hypothetical protein